MHGSMTRCSRPRKHKRVNTGTLALIGVLLLGGLAGCGGTAANSAPAAASVAGQVRALLGRMTLDEKVGQMALISVDRLWGNCQGSPGPLNTQCLQHVLITRHVGAILSGGGAAPTPNTPQAWAEMTNAIQRYAVRHSRLHIPILYGADAVHGHNNVLGATLF